MVIDTEEATWLYPDHVILIGGGRWARVLLEVLCDLVPTSVSISIHSLHNAQAMLEWVSALGLAHRISVSPNYPKWTAEKSGAVIVANAAGDHEKAIEWALSQHLPVLVEKPVSLNSRTTRRLANLAISQKVYLAAAHVFLFARYVTFFSNLVNEAQGIKAIYLQWMDPQAESRYGEVKSYDLGLTIYADWLPHVLSILGILSPNPIRLGRRMEVSRGGAQLNMDVRLGDIPCNIELERNGASRQRRIEVVTLSGLEVLDFSIEPGKIISAASVRCGDPDWDVDRRPAAAMLRAFLHGAAGGECDKRLSIDIGMQANLIIDQISPAYQMAVEDWLGKKYPKMEEEGADVDLRYALSEIICSEERLSPVLVAQRVDYVYRHLKNVLATPLYAEYESRPIELINLILKQAKLASYL